MDYKNTLEAILDNVEEIKAILAGFASEKKIQAIEMDLALEKVRNLYDIMLMLKQSYPEEKKGPVKNSEEAKERTPADDIKTVSDRFKSHTASIHDSFTRSQQYEELSEKLKSKPILDIGTAIGVNDKFIFIKELFNGDPDIYSNTIEVLNNATNFNDAYNYLIGNFEWDMDSPLVQILLDLIRRKLIVNKNE
jgi:hypothetical protein